METIGDYISGDSTIKVEHRQGYTCVNDGEITWCCHTPDFELACNMTYEHDGSADDDAVVAYERLCDAVTAFDVDNPDDQGDIAKCVRLFVLTAYCGHDTARYVASSAAAELGRRGGSKTSPAKRRSSAANGRKGGRPVAYDISELLDADRGNVVRRIYDASDRTTEYHVIDKCEQVS